MPYEQLEEGVTADVTYRAWGHDLAELFTAAADATAGAMFGSLENIQPRMMRRVSIQADALDLLLMRFLDELVFYKDAEGLATRARGVRIEAHGQCCRAEAELWGESIDRERHELHGDVKAVTLEGLCVHWSDSGWCAQFTLDV